FADFMESGDFFQADGEAFGVAVFYRDAVAVRADTETSLDEASAVPFAEELLRFFFHFFFFAADEGDDVAEDVQRRHTGIASTRNGLHSNDKHFVETESIGEWFQDEN